jgi:hypothetical protein
MNVVGVAFASYPVTDLTRARQFYEGVLGLTEARFFLGKRTLDSSNMILGLVRSASAMARLIGSRPQGAVRSRWKWMILMPRSRVSKRKAARSVVNRWRHQSVTWQSSLTRMGIL